MATMQSMMIYVAPEQRKALQRRAKAQGTKVAEEIRHAIDAYLAGISKEELALLDTATREAAEHIQAMTERLEGTNKRLDAAFAELERMRGKQIPEADREAA
jgi:guanylate kinase